MPALDKNKEVTKEASAAILEIGGDTWSLIGICIGQRPELIKPIGMA